MKEYLKNKNIGNSSLTANTLLNRKTKYNGIYIDHPNKELYELQRMADNSRQVKDSYEMQELADQYVQAKLKISQPGDPAEIEADNIADEIIKNKKENKQSDDLAGIPQKKDDKYQDTILKDCKGCKKETENNKVYQGIIEQVKSHILTCPGKPLLKETLDFFSEKMGNGLSTVRIHTCDAAASLAESLNANAFTYKNHIFFNTGQYQPDTKEGKRLLAHELTHVLQQNINEDAIQKQSITSPSPCFGSSTMPGNIAWQGTLEHVAIQQYYITYINPMAEIEYYIPQSGPNGGMGKADIVDPIGGIYEIKFMLFTSNALTEVLRYIAMARVHCNPDVPWHAGLFYPYTIIPFIGDTEIVSWLDCPGVIVYYTRKKQRERQRQRQPVRRPVTSPKFDFKKVMKKINRFIRDVVKTGKDAYEAAKRFLNENQDVLRYIGYAAAGVLITAAVAIVVATIIEDILSAGAGILDDPASFAVAWALVRVALQMVR